MIRVLDLSSLTICQPLLPLFETKNCEYTDYILSDLLQFNDNLIKMNFFIDILNQYRISKFVLDGLFACSKMMYFFWLSMTYDYVFGSFWYQFREYLGDFRLEN